MAEYDQADLFLIPLLDGTFALGQIALCDGMPAGFAMCLLSLRKGGRNLPPLPLDASGIAAALLISDAHLADGTWPIIGFDTIPRLPLPATDTPHDAAVAEALANALHGLYPWDGFPDSAFFDGLLLVGVARPADARMTSAF